jgi:predicted GNAT family acetyltransferase
MSFTRSSDSGGGKDSFFHVKSENGAKVAYQKIGFRLRAAIRLTVISIR